MILPLWEIIVPFLIILAASLNALSWSVDLILDASSLTSRVFLPLINTLILVLGPDILKYVHLHAFEGSEYLKAGDRAFPVIPSYYILDLTVKLVAC